MNKRSGNHPLSTYFHRDLKFAVDRMISTISPLFDIICETDLYASNSLTTFAGSTPVRR